MELIVTSLVNEFRGRNNGRVRFDGVSLFKGRNFEIARVPRFT